MTDIGFDEVEANAGVDIGNTAFLSVPLKGYNLIFHTLGKDAKLHFPSNALDVRDVTDAIKRQEALADTFALLLKIPMAGLEPSKAFAKISAVWKTSQAPGNYRLLLVSGKVPGRFTLTAKTERRRADLSVCVLSAVQLQLTLRFLKYTGTDGAVFGSQWTVSDTKNILDKLNGIYTRQTNITFELQRVTDFGVATPFSQPIDTKFIQDLLRPAADKTSWATLFFVGKLVAPNRGLHFLEKPTYIVLVDRPTMPEAPDEDAFGINVAHEIGHALAGSGHPHRNHVLMSDLIQSAKIDKPLLDLMRQPDRLD